MRPKKVKSASPAAASKKRKSASPSATSNTALEPPKHVSQVDLTGMNDADLFTYNKATGRAARNNLSVLFNGLLEAETRFDKRPGLRTDLSDDYPQTWADYCKACGTSADTFRAMKSRNNRELAELMGQKYEPPQAKFQARLQALANLKQARKEFGKAAEGGNEKAQGIINDYETEAGMPLTVWATSAAVEVEDEDDDIIEGEVIKTEAPVVTREEKDREQLRYLVKRLNSISETLQQVLDKKAKWSKYPEYADLVTRGEKIAGLVKLLSEPEPTEPTSKPTTDDSTLPAEEMAETKAWADEREADKAAFRAAHTCHSCGKQFKRKYHSAKRHETTYRHDDESTCVVRDCRPTNIRLMAAAAELKAKQEREAAWQAEYEKEEGTAK